MKISSLVLAVVLIIPCIAFAGESVDVNIDNRVTQISSGYPRLTAHISGGSNCYYDMGLADWNQFAKPGASVSIYSERKGSGSCFLSNGIREFTLYMQESDGAAWVPIGPQYRLDVGTPPRGLHAFDSIYPDGGIWESAKSEAWLAQPGACGLSVEVRVDILDPSRTWFTVSGTASPNCAGYIYYASNTAATRVRAAAASLESSRINLKIGQSKTIKLGDLDPGSVWELDSCLGASGEPSGAVPHFTRKKSLLTTFTFKATHTGSESCQLTAWHNPERTKVVTIQLVFNVE
jgi:hypothetical protein